MIVNGNIEIEEQKDGAYIFPVQKKGDLPSWAIYVFKDGRSDLYMKRTPTGVLLGKPITLPIAKKRPDSCNHDLNNNDQCKYCGKEFRRV